MGQRVFQELELNFGRFVLSINVPYILHWIDGDETPRNELST